MWKNKRYQDPDNAPAGGGSATPAAPSAPSPTPAAAPASAAPAASSASTSAAPGSTNAAPADAFDFGALIDHHAGVETVEPVAPVAPATQAPAPAATPVALVAAAPVAPVTPPAPTEPAAQPAAPATAQPPASEEQPPQQVNWEEHRKTHLPKLVDMYKLSDEEVQDIQTNPGTAFPKLAAQLHYNISMAINAAMQQLLPQAIQGQMRMHSLKQTYENKFYDKWPALKAAVAKDPKTEESINQAFEAFRATNPKATIDDLISKAGLLAMISLGLNPMEGQQQALAAPAAAPAVPAIIPGRPAGTGSQGHVPVVPHGQAPGASSGGNIFEELANHWNSGG